MDKLKLKPCPFCGFDAYSQIRVKQGVSYDAIRVVVVIKCKNCDASQEVSAESGCSIDAMQEMIARVANYWNRRCQVLPELSGGEAS
jgi:Lar family restriction alleviation protein